jgi:hypothetical protein
MECSETYKNWVKYLKMKGLYCEYLYTMGKVVDHNFFSIFSQKDRPKSSKTFILSSSDITGSPFWGSTRFEHITRPDLIKIMKEVDNRISSLNNVYRYRDGVDKVFTRDIVWADVVREFYIDELRQKYGEEALERMYKRREIRREQLRKAEEERRKKHWEEISTWSFDLDMPDIRVETARTAATYTGVPRHRNREERGQWYDRINRNNIRRQDRWRFRR